MNIIYRAFLYDLMYEMANKYLKEYNPCKIKFDINNQPSCNGYENMCCGDCKYLSDKGCIVRALPCKLWLCQYLRNDKYSKINKAFHKLRKISWYYRLEYDIRMPRSFSIKFMRRQKYAL